MNKAICLVATLLMAACAQTGAQIQPDPPNAAEIAGYEQRSAQTSPAQIVDWLKQGNARFASGRSTHGGFPTDSRRRVKLTAPKQNALAVVLSCVDSRISPDHVFDTGIGDIVSVRVSAGVINDDVLGGLEGAVGRLGAKTVVIMGHKDCQGVKGACAGAKFEHLTQLLERVKPAIATANAYLDKNPAISSAVGDRVPGNRKYVAQVSHFNSKQSTQQVLEKSTFLKEKVKKGEIILVTALYDVDTGTVEFDPPEKVAP